MSSRLRYINLQCSTRMDRHDGIDAAKDLLSAAGAWIVDFNMFSNRIFTIRYLMDFENVAKFPGLFEDSDFVLFQDSLEGVNALIQELEVLPQAASEEVSGSLVVHFVNNEPDLIIEVPAIPG